MTHAQERLYTRFGERFGWVSTALVATVDDELGRDPADDFAVVGAHLPFQGTPWTDTSNGDVAVAIVRGGALTTVMFRRSTQPMTPRALRVDRVVYAGVEGSR